MIVLDTNVISELMKPRPDARVRDWMLAQTDDVLGTTAVTVAEIEFGLQRLPDGKRKAELYRRFETFLELLPVLHLDDRSGREAGCLRAQRAGEGLASQPSDMLIAGIASTAGARLATRNTSDFAALPLQVINPWAS